jgi:hypothetical protein
MEAASLSLNEMRLIEALCMEGNSRLLSANESNFDILIEVLDVNGAVKECRWDCIVIK